MVKSLTRRQVLRLGVLAGVGAVAAACSKEVEVTRVVEKEVTIEVVKEVTKLVEKGAKKQVQLGRCFIENELPMDTLIGQYNALAEREQDNVEISCVSGWKGYTDAVLVEMMSSGEEIPWSAGACLTPFLELGNAVQMGTVQPFDPYFSTSQYAAYADILFGDDLLESARKDVSYDDQIYGFPLQADLVPWVWNKSLWAKAGFTEKPATLDQAIENMVEIQNVIGPDGGFAFAPETNLFRGMMSVHQAYSTSDKLYTDEGLINFEDEGFLQAMEWYKQTIDKKLVPKGWEDESADYEALFGRQLTATFISMHGRGSRGAMIWGFENLGMGPLPIGNAAIQTAGMMFWFTTAGLYKAAPYPQEAVDFYLWAFQPENSTMGNKFFDSGKLAAWKSYYDKWVDATDVSVNWALELKKGLENSTPPPVTPWFSAEMSVFQPLFVKFLQGEGTAEATGKAIAEGVQAEIAKSSS